MAEASPISLGKGAGPWLAQSNPWLHSPGQLIKNFQRRAAAPMTAPTPAGGARSEAVREDRASFSSTATFPQPTALAGRSARVMPRGSLLLALTVFALLAVAALLTAQWNLKRQQEVENWIPHTYQVMSELSDLSGIFQDMSGSARGFLIGGNPRFLESYAAARRSIWPQFDRIRDLIADNPLQRGRLVELGKSLEAGVQFRDRVVAAVREQGPAAGRQLMDTGEGSLSLEQVRQKIALLKGEEQRLLELRLEAAGRMRRQLIWAQFTLMFLILVLLTGGYVLLRRYLRAERLSAQTLLEMHQRLAAVVNSSVDAIIGKDINGTIQSWNPAAHRMFGYSPQEIIGRPVTLIFPSDLHQEEEMILGKIRRGEPIWQLESVRRCKDGKLIDVSITISPIKDSAGKVVGAAKIVQDITERKRGQQELIASQRQLQAILRANERIMEQSLDVICTIDREGRFVQVSNACRNVWHYEPQELVGRRYIELVHPEDHEKTIQAAQGVMAGQATVDFENRYFRKDGSVVDIIWSAHWSAEDQLMYCAARDHTERRRLDNTLRTSLKEKETLLQEIHHRVKNNLQIVASMLNMQRSMVGDPAAQACLQECRDRIRQMALIHEKLYRSENLSQIDFGEHIRELTSLLTRSYTAPNVRLEVFAQPALLLIDTAIPLGLILSELISNVFKHAFPNGKAGRIEINFASKDPNTLELSVRDNGIGFAPNFDWRKSNSLGMRMVHGLSQQIEGNLAVESSSQNGTRISVTFPWVSSAA